jgi:hypothetical protein
MRLYAQGYMVYLCHDVGDGPCSTCHGNRGYRGPARININSKISRAHSLPIAFAHVEGNPFSISPWPHFLVSFMPLC